MNADLTINITVFEVKRFLKKETFLEQSPTQASDGVKAAWRAVQSKTNARPAQVRRIYSEWQPSQEDAAFISSTFPGAAVSYSFSRPADDAWEEAFRDASRAMQAASGKSPVSAAPERRPPAEAALFPVLRTYEAGDGFAKAIVHRVVGADLAVFLAHVGPTLNGTIGIDYVMRNSVELSAQSLNGLFEMAWQNIGNGLQVNVQEGSGERVFALSHPRGMGASALCLPDFYDQARSWLGREELFVAFTDPDNLFVTLPNSPAADKLRQAVEQSRYWGAVALTPACYHLSKSGLRQVTVRTAPA
jgi:hypothetical protein